MADPPANGTPGSDGIVGRVRGASISLLNANPQLGMWQAAGTAIAQAPNLTELRDPASGGDNISFNAQGHSARFAVQERDGELALAKTSTRTGDAASSPRDQPAFRSVFNDKQEEGQDTHAEADESRVLMGDVHAANGDSAPNPRQQFQRRQSLHEKHMGKEKAPWKTTVAHGLKAFWKFFLTPSGFVITIYCLNIVAWGVSLAHLISPSHLTPHLTSPPPQISPLTTLSGDAFLSAHQCRPGDELPLRRRRQLTAQEMARNLQSDPQRPLLRHRLRSRPLALPRLVPVHPRRQLQGPRSDAQARSPEQGLVPPARLDFRGRRQGPHAHFYRPDGPAHGAVEAGIYHLDDGAQHAVAGCSVLLHVGI
nr:uncharacterized protein CTRU02_12605 [Colletotrichum truncatum]KAF6784343.1 hypothetical protein CTRU02_12605 [Colletotrichum truncatum]